MKNKKLKATNTCKLTKECNAIHSTPFTFNYCTFLSNITKKIIYYLYIYILIIPNSTAIVHK